MAGQKPENHSKHCSFSSLARGKVRGLMDLQLTVNPTQVFGESYEKDLSVFVLCVTGGQSTGYCLKNEQRVQL